MVYVMEGESRGLVEAATQSAEQIARSMSPLLDGDVLLFDCVSRMLFLEEAYGTELEKVQESLPQGTSLVGALTLGEIASSQWGPIQFLNKTAVVSCCRGNAA